MIIAPKHKQRDTLEEVVWIQFQMNSRAGRLWCEPDQSQQMYAASLS